MQGSFGKDEMGVGWRHWLEPIALENSNDLGQLKPVQVRRAWGARGSIKQQPLFLGVYIYRILKKGFRPMSRTGQFPPVMVWVLPEGSGGLTVSGVGWGSQSCKFPVPSTGKAQPQRKKGPLYSRDQM